MVHIPTDADYEDVMLDQPIDAYQKKVNSVEDLIHPEGRLLAHTYGISPHELPFLNREFIEIQGAGLIPSAKEEDPINAYVGRLRPAAAFRIINLELLVRKELRVPIQGDTLLVGNRTIQLPHSDELAIERKTRKEHLAKAEFARRYMDDHLQMQINHYRALGILPDD